LQEPENHELEVALLEHPAGLPRAAGATPSSGPPQVAKVLKAPTAGPSPPRAPRVAVLLSGAPTIPVTNPHLSPLPRYSGDMSSRARYVCDISRVKTAGRLDGRTAGGLNGWRPGRLAAGRLVVLASRAQRLPNPRSDRMPR